MVVAIAGEYLGSSLLPGNLPEVPRLTNVGGQSKFHDMRSAARLASRQLLLTSPSPPTAEAIEVIASKTAVFTEHIHSAITIITIMFPGS